MKPRFQDPPWTDEDKSVIYFRLTHAARHGYNFYDKLSVYLDADRRDADRMLEAQCARWCELSLVTGLIFKPGTCPYLGPAHGPQRSNWWEATMKPRLKAPAPGYVIDFWSADKLIAACPSIRIARGVADALNQVSEEHRFRAETAKEYAATKRRVRCAR